VRDALTSVPVSGAAVSAHILIPDSIGIYDTTDVTGAYAISGIPTGNQIYVIIAYASGYKSFYSRFANLGDGEFTMDVFLEAEQSSPPGGDGDSTTLSGFVMGQSGSGKPLVRLAAAAVEVKTGPTMISALTDGTGHYTMEVKVGSYGISVTAPGYQSSTSSSISIASTGLSYGAVLKQTATDVVRSEVFPGSIALFEAYPNPFNPATVIRYAIPGAGGLGLGTSRVRLVVYDLLGREVAVLVNENKAPGNYEVTFSAKGGSASGGNAAGLASGVYLYRLTAGDFVQTHKMLLIR
jgi:hypothetical protein